MSLSSARSLVVAVVAGASLLLSPTVAHAAPVSYTAAQVAAHNSASDCWTIVGSNVYDVTAWIGQHPGGPAVITGMCGKNGTAAFTGRHGSQGRPASVLAGFKVGALAAPAKKAITCVKGSAKKKVTAANPKCPTGWKKK